jgi:hypothetical protein
MLQVEYSYLSDGIKEWKSLETEFKEEIICPMVIESLEIGTYHIIAGKYIYKM